mmetsp:Transcript_70341/g.124228  ORF Transcript_70341/g.124228 Transcript_70341/m.124228 type:complete len:686 (-) Transcript_70341:89-2146(-)|eukprot:CAMPEP_0197658812 /NCGR_PEP_ID=MMETSP1338-20131121/45458_1 /TAXON_ID=43686 ORGANISM="Pelagodinium beii, Strain RCC1491" /NCGR_SAMPLE_ID=MMETSP1338 /ASSEMBLY_ACC=CAM_ASM_000754 /LENGTH=685 /DNA_ID=CAMNT_0043235471 /DNA_START=60 /DNA_END=2117 /DNA_ORIENTATION=-
MALTANEAGGALSASQRHVALGGTPGAPKQLEEGCRWVGGQAQEIDKRLLGQCTSCTENGKVMDLNFHFKFLKGMDGLEQHAPNLRSLDFSANNIREIENLTGMSKLRDLKLDSCQISCIQGLDKLPSLVSLHLEDNQISILEGLEKLFVLEILDLNRNRIQRLGRSLSKLSKLKELRLHHNKLSSLDGIAGLANLEVLDAGFNQIESISAEDLKGLTKLDDLQLAGNMLSGLGFLSGTGPGRSLAMLDLSDNVLTAASVRGLPTVPLLCELNLAGNQLEVLPDNLMSSCPSLEILDLSRNKIESPKEVERLKSMISLKELSVEGNPMTRSRDELTQVLGTLTQMEYVDNRQIVPLAALEDGDALDAETFRLTNAPATPGGALVPRPGTASRPTTASRPGTSSGRPGTSSGRPGTAQSLKEAGVQQPLMHAKSQSNVRKCASTEQADQWEQQTKSGLEAIQKQVEKTSQQAERELRDMQRYAQKAKDANRRQEELEARRAAQDVAQDQASEPGKEVVIDNKVKKSPEVMAATPSPARASPREATSSKASLKLREAVGAAREAPVEELDLDQVEDSEVKSIPASPSRPPLSPVIAACDEVEEVEEAAEVAEDPPEIPAAEVEEDMVRESSLPPEETVVKPARPASGNGDKELRVGVRASVRRASSRTRNIASPGGIKGGYPGGRVR